MHMLSRSGAVGEGTKRKRKRSYRLTRHEAAPSLLSFSFLFFIALLYSFSCPSLASFFSCVFFSFSFFFSALLSSFGVLSPFMRSPPQHLASYSSLYSGHPHPLPIPPPHLPIQSLTAPAHLHLARRPPSTHTAHRTPPTTPSSLPPSLPPSSTLALSSGSVHDLLFCCFVGLFCPVRLSACLSVLIYHAQVLMPLAPTPPPPSPAASLPSAWLRMHATRSYLLPRSKQSANSSQVVPAIALALADLET